MADWGLIAIRFALYADLMLLVGLSAFPLYSFTRAERNAREIMPIGTLLIWLIVAGMAFSAAGFAVASAAMMGEPVGSLNLPMLSMMASETAVGAALKVCLWALTVVLASLVFIRRNQTARLGCSLVGGSVALATLLWAGHAGATEGALGVAHRISDIAHMIAAAVWIGGIGAFALLLRRPAQIQSAAHVIVVVRSLENFSHVGTAAVGIVVLTGIFNGFVILGADVSPIFYSTYGLLLLAKVALFAVMLVLSANNRWKITPSLKQSLHSGGTETAWKQLRLSIAWEATAGAAVLALVAWLGTLAPTASY